MDELNATDGEPTPEDAPQNAVEAPDEPTPAEAPEVPAEGSTEAPANAQNDSVLTLAESGTAGSHYVAPELSLTALKADARSRALRSLAQGALAAVLAQVWLVIYPLAVQFQLGKPMHIDWQSEATVVGGAAVYGLVAYLHKALGIGEK